jgi:helicase
MSPACETLSSNGGGDSLTANNLNLWRFLEILFKRSIAPGILKCLRDSQRQSAKGLKFGEICEILNIAEVERGNLSDTLKALREADLVEREDADVFRITVQGLRAVEEFERLSKDMELANLPMSAREIMRRHAHSFLLPGQKDFLTQHIPLSRNMIVMASPSAGKTLLAECCMLDCLQKGGRVLYITPYKALNRQKYELFAKIFGEYDIVRTDGDAFPRIQSLLKARVVVATYEKALMSVLRDEQWLRGISLAVADEITLLSDKERGPSLDLLLSVLKTRCKILTLSSHVGNASVIKEWLHADLYEVPPKEMTDEYIVQKNGSSISIESFTGSEKAYCTRTSAIKAILKHSKLKDDDTMIVLVGERSKAEKRASEISRLFSPRKDLVNALADADEKTTLLRRLDKTLRRGVAFHHAGLAFDVRESVERLLDDRLVRVIVSTPTLSHGVDFPLDHIVMDLNSFREERLSKIDYVQCKGRASRYGKSRGGNVYVLSEKATTDDSVRRFLCKPVEDVFPPRPEADYLEWVVFLSCLGREKRSTKTVLTYSKRLLNGLLAFRNPRFKTHSAQIDRLLRDALKSLKSMGLISLQKNRIAITRSGNYVSKIDWVPHDSCLILKMLETLSSIDQSDDKIERVLLVFVCYVGLLRRFDRSRTGNIGLTFLHNLSESGIQPPDKFVLGHAMSSVLAQWIDEVPIQRILKNCTTGRLVHDEDIRKLGTYASVEMRKTALLAQALGYKRVADIANRLAIRLKRGVRDDLLSEEPATDLSRLEDLGRRRLRFLHEHRLRNILDIYRVVFDEGDPAFVEKSKLPQNLARGVIDQLHALVQSDARLAELCKKL